jgi:hypothetical protein
MSFVVQHKTTRNDSDIYGIFRDSDVVEISHTQYSRFRIIPDNVHEVIKYRKGGGEDSRVYVILLRLQNIDSSAEIKCPKELVPHLLGKDKERLKGLLKENGVKSAVVLKF